MDKIFPGGQPATEDAKILRKLQNRWQSNCEPFIFRGSSDPYRGVWHSGRMGCGVRMFLHLRDKVLRSRLRMTRPSTIRIVVFLQEQIKLFKYVSLVHGSHVNHEQNPVLLVHYARCISSCTHILARVLSDARVQIDLNSVYRR